MKTGRRRGLEDIRLRMNLCGDAHSPHRRYLKVANLELRKSLCCTVRQAALLRVAEMDRQLAAIETEQSKLLQAGPLGQQAQEEPDDERLAALGALPGSRGFTIKY
jgi:hypothetical protein